MTKTEQLRMMLERLVDDIWEDVSGLGEGDVPHHSIEYYKVEAVRIVREAKCVFVAEDQTVERLPKDGTPEAVLSETNDPYMVAQYGHLYCCKEMRSTGFVRIKEIGEE